MINWFKSRHPKFINLSTDIHSHLLPGLDDGVKTFNEVESVLQRFIDCGYNKVITTPHVMGDLYKNTPEGILEKLGELQKYLLDRNIPIQVEAAAEYYLDEHLIRTLEENKKILTFGKKYLLFETNFISEPLNLKEFIFMVITRGYIPVLAHPERYHFLHNNLSKVKDLLDRGVLLQMNIGSILGFYSKEIQTFSSRIINEGHVHFLGSDCHNVIYSDLLTIATQSKTFRKALALPLLNNTL